MVAATGLLQGAWLQKPSYPLAPFEVPSPVAKTPPSLLERLREHPDDAAAWDRFDALYRPLLSTWLKRYTIQPHDADDLLQDIFQTLLKEVPRFEYDPAKGRFRGWLRRVFVNHLRDFWREQRAHPRGTGDSDFLEKVLNQLEDPKSELSILWNQEHDQHVSRHLLGLIEADFSPSTWAAFKRLMAGDKPAAVAADLKISVNAVYLAKSSVLKRLREEMDGLAD